MSESPSVVTTLVARMRKAARALPDSPLEAADCLFSGAAVLELIEQQHRNLFDRLSGPPRIVRYDMPPDAVIEPGPMVHSPIPWSGLWTCEACGSTHQWSSSRPTGLERACFDKAPLHAKPHLRVAP